MNDDMQERKTLRCWEGQFHLFHGADGVFLGLSGQRGIVSRRSSAASWIFCGIMGLAQRVVAPPLWVFVIWRC